MSEKTRLSQATNYKEAGEAIASMYGTMPPTELSGWFTRLFPTYATGQDWENFKLGYLSGLWQGAEELASPVFVADTNPDEHRTTDAVGFMTLAFITSRSGKLELLDQSHELM